LGISGVETQSHYWNYVALEQGMVRNEYYNELVSLDIELGDIIGVKV